MTDSFAVSGMWATIFTGVLWFCGSCAKHICDELFPSTIFFLEIQSPLLFLITRAIKIYEYFLSTWSRDVLVMDVLAEEIDFLKRN